MAHNAADTNWAGTGLRDLCVPLVDYAAGGLLVLLGITALSVFKPWGMTAYGRCRTSQANFPRPSAGAGVTLAPALLTGSPRWARIVGFHALALLVLFVVLHITGGGFGHHGH